MRSLRNVSVLLAVLRALLSAAQASLASSALPSSDQSVQANHASRWWHDDAVKHELGLSAEQSAQLERIVRASVPKFRETKREYDRLEALLSVLIADPKSTESQVAQQADLVEVLRGRIGKMRTMMLYRMRCVLTPDQRGKLDQLLRKSRDHSSYDRDGT